MSAAESIGVTDRRMSRPSLGGRKVSFIEVDRSMISPTAAIVTMVPGSGVGCVSASAIGVVKSRVWQPTARNTRIKLRNNGRERDFIIERSAPLMQQAADSTAKNGTWQISLVPLRTDSLFISVPVKA